MSLPIRSEGNRPVSMDAQFLQALHTQGLQAGVDQIPGEAARTLVQESINSEQAHVLSRHVDNLRTTLSSVVDNLRIDREISDSVKLVQESAAVAGALLAADSAPQARGYELPQPSENRFVIPAEGVPNYLGHRSKALAVEAFDNRENRSAVLYTMAYNYSLARQDALGEMIWPTLTLPADQVGFGIVVNRLTVWKGIQHSIDGKAVEANKVDLMRAEANHEILRKNRNRVFPVARAQNAAKLVEATIIAPYDIDNEGETLTTAPYRVGVECDILGMSQTDASLSGGAFNQTDTLDPAVSLERVYAKIGDDVVSFSVYSMPGANFTYAPQGMDKQRNLTFKNKALSLTPTTTRVTGDALTSLDVLAAKKLKVFVEVNMTGQMNIEFGNVEVYGNRIAIVKVLDEDGAVLPATNSDVQDLQALFASAKLVGYDLRAFKTNINMRERGDLIDRSSFTQLYEVPLLSPVTAQRPQNTDGQLDAGDFEALVTTTRFRLKNDAITAIFDACARLADFTASSAGQLNAEQLPSVLGAARFHVLPRFFAPAPFDLTKLVDSLTSGNRVDDLQAAIVNIVRDFAFRLYVESEYQAAMSALGYSGPVTITIVTDPIIHQYLMITGDLRTGTELFKVRVESTIDRRFAGKLFMTFGIFDENRNQAPNILNWGNLIWAPEVVMSASVPRGESLSRETIVQPRYLFVNHLPVAAMLEFSNIPDILKKLPLNIQGDINSNDVTPTP